MTHFSELKKLNYKEQKYILIQTAGSIATTMLINNIEPGGRREGGGYCKCAVCESHNFLIPLQYAEKNRFPPTKN